MCQDAGVKYVEAIAVMARYTPSFANAVSAKVIGVDPKTLRTLGWAEERGLGTADLGKIRTLGLTLNEAYRKDTITNVEICNRKHECLKLVRKTYKTAPGTGERC